MTGHYSSTCTREAWKEGDLWHPVQSDNEEVEETEEVEEEATEEEAEEGEEDDEEDDDKEDGVESSAEEGNRGKLMLNL
jgi:hypothetical protein